MGDEFTQRQLRRFDDVAKSKTGLVIKNTNRRVSSTYVVPAYRQNTVTHGYSIYVQMMQRIMEVALPKNMWDAGSCEAVPTLRYRGRKMPREENATVRIVRAII